MGTKTAAALIGLTVIISSVLSQVSYESGMTNAENASDKFVANMRRLVGTS